MKQQTTQPATTAKDTTAQHNAEVKTFRQIITDTETGVVVKSLYYLRIVRGNVTVQINVGEKTYTQIKTLTEEKMTETKTGVSDNPKDYGITPKTKNNG